MNLRLSPGSVRRSAWCAIALVIAAALCAPRAGAQSSGPAEQAALRALYAHVPEHHAMLLAGLALRALAVEVGATESVADNLALSHATSLWIGCMFDLDAFNGPRDLKVLIASIDALVVRTAQAERALRAHSAALHGRTMGVPDTSAAVCTPEVLAAAARVHPLWPGHGTTAYPDEDGDGVYDPIARLGWGAGYQTGDIYWIVRLGAIAIARGVRAGVTLSDEDIARARRAVARFEWCAQRADPEGWLVLRLETWMLDTVAREIAWQAFSDESRLFDEAPLPLPPAQSHACHESALDD